MVLAILVLVVLSVSDIETEFRGAVRVRQLALSGEYRRVAPRGYFRVSPACGGVDGGREWSCEWSSDGEL